LDGNSTKLINNHENKEEIKRNTFGFIKLIQKTYTSSRASQAYLKEVIMDK
jgi:hypothetical protein